MNDLAAKVAELDAKIDGIRDALEALARRLQAGPAVDPSYWHALTVQRRRAQMRLVEPIKHPVPAIGNCPPAQVAGTGTNWGRS